MFSFSDFNDLNIGTSIFLIMFMGAFGMAIFKKEKKREEESQENGSRQFQSIDSSLVFNKVDIKNLEKVKKETEKEKKILKKLHEILKDAEVKRNQKLAQNKQ